jgi:hypothetical protein
MIFTWGVWTRIGRLTLWIGAIATAVAAFGGLYFTNKQFGFSQEQFELSQKQFRLSQEGQAITEQGEITDRFTKAIEDLGSVGLDKLDVRLGGIYTLERLSQDSTADEPTIMEVLGAYVRNHAAEPPVEDALAPVTCARAPLSDMPIDIQAVVTVIARRDPNVAEREPHRVDLSNSCLEGVGLYDIAQLRDVSLFSSDLRSAYFSNRDLRGAVLDYANLGDARLDHAKLACRPSPDASKTPGCSPHDRTTLSHAHLPAADLTGADLSNADLTHADLHCAKLYGADLSGAILTGAQLDVIFYDNYTKWPNGFKAPPSSPAAAAACEQLAMDIDTPAA